MEFTVHRGATVYTPRGIVIVNPPSKAQSRRLEQAGGAASAAIWMADGMEAAWVDKIQGGRAAGLRRTLLDQGIDPETVEVMVAQSGLDTGKAAKVEAPPQLLERVENEASSLALAVSETRQTLKDLQEHAVGSLADLYQDDYPSALHSAGLERVDLVERFPVLTGQYGYSRGDHEPGATRLRAFTAKDGGYVVYGEVAATEALIMRLRPTVVVKWLRSLGHKIQEANEERNAYNEILRAMGADLSQCPVFDAVTRLVHSFSHRMVRQSSFYAGIDRNALSELLFPASLSFVTFAAPRGDFVLGGLQALFEHDLHTVLDRVVFDESRCALDPGCSSNPTGAACAVCLHLGEPSCRMFNTQLDRRTLFGDKGYFAMVENL